MGPRGIVACESQASVSRDSLECELSARDFSLSIVRTSAILNICIDPPLVGEVFFLPSPCFY